MEYFQIIYFSGIPFDDTSKYQHKQLIQFSWKKMNATIKFFVDKGYSVGIITYKDSDTLVLMIDQQGKRFQQR